MYNIMENPPISKFILLQIDDTLVFRNEAITFFCLLDGQLTFVSQEKTYHMRPGDILLLTDTYSDYLSSSEGALVLCAHFDYLFFQENFGDDFPLLSCNSMEEPDRDYTRLLSLLAELSLAQIDEQERNRFLIQRQIFSLFHFLKANFIDQTGEISSESRQEYKLARFNNFMRKHCADPLTLQDAADYMGYTPQYLSSFIKKYQNRTFNASLNQARLEKALPYIKYRNDPPQRIASNCGFSNYNSFCRLFSDTYHLSPEEYRADFRQRIKNNVEHNIGYISDPAVMRDKLLNLIRFVEEDPKTIETSVKKVYSFDARRTEPLHPNWNQIINLGDALSFEKPLFREHVAMLQDQFHFTYGRFSGILQTMDTFCDENDPEDQSKWTFGFNRTFRLIDFLLSHNLKPQIDFGGKPFNIYQLNRTHIYQNHEDYVAHLRTILEHFIYSCINRYGYQEMSSWNFEYWMHYDQFMTRLDSPEEYCREFSFFYRTIKSILPSASIGAPGFNLFMPLKLMKDALIVLKKNQLRPDFISILFYPYAVPENVDPDTGFSLQITDDPRLLYRKADEVYYILREIGWEDTPLFVTEYSNVVISQNFINDSVYQGCFIMKQALDNLDHIPAMAYFLATDYSLEYQDSAELLFGGNGLLSKDGIPKPGYHAYSFLSRLEGQLVGKGDNFIITRTPQQTIQVILYNYVHFSGRYCQDPGQYTSVKNPDSAFRREPPLHIDLDITHVKPGSYKVTQYVLNSDHGSILNLWIKYSYSRHIRPDELSHLRASCLPEMTLDRVEISDTIHISQTLGRNEIVMLTYYYMY